MTDHDAYVPSWHFHSIGKLFWASIAHNMHHIAIASRNASGARAAEMMTWVTKNATFIF
jgi:hypothetical protein